MYCPKCNETFEEGSRRFCPTDGSRLISEPQPQQARAGGIFANLIPKIEALSELDKNLDRPVAKPGKNLDEAADMPFFELDDPELDLGPIERPGPLPQATQNSEAETRPLGRKVNPLDIPAGHVDLSGANRFPSPVESFSMDQPERFVGRTVKGRYVVTEFLGGDLTGFAYLGEDKLSDERKVLVRILIEDNFDEIMSSVLAEERVSLSHFSHPNIARLIDSGEFTNGVNFLVSEYVDALSVADVLTIHGKFEPQRTGRLLLQASGALNDAHQEGIIHRDIRPENLIIDPLAETEQLRVVNFGASNGEANEFNLAYKAPEVLDGRIATVSSDIFSLAVVAFEMLTGELPFAGSDEREQLRSQNSGLVKRASELNPAISRGVDEVFERGLAFDPADRYPKARDLGESLQSALALSAAVPDSEPLLELVQAPPVAQTATQMRRGEVIELDPIVPPVKPPVTPPVSEEKPEPNWKNRSPEPPETGETTSLWPMLAGLAALGLLIAAIWYFAPVQQNEVASNSANQIPANTGASNSAVEMPPLPRTIAQPPNSRYYQNTKQDLKGDLLRNFVGFTLYYPESWKVNGPQNGTTAKTRGKFLDIARETPDGRPLEQMLISYYPSKGTFDQDEEIFPQMVKETNETLSKLLPGYQMVSAGEIKVNQSWRAYEVKFQAGGESETGEKLVVWGRRLFVPAARPGVRNGFEVTMLATSLSGDVRSVDDVGVKGELATILETFEPSQNF